MDILKNFFERIAFEGYTYKELCAAAGGGDGDNDEETGSVLDGYQSVTERNALGHDIKGLDVSYNSDGSIDVTYGRYDANPFNNKTISSAPNGKINEGGWLDSLAFDMGFRSTFSMEVDPQTGRHTTNFDPVGLFNATLNMTYGTMDGYDTVTMTGGSIASTLNQLGLSGTQSIVAEAGISIAASIALGQPIGAISPTAKAMQAMGVIDEKTSHTIQAAGLVAGFLQGTVSTMQSLSAVQKAYSYGAISGVQAALMGGVIGYSMYSSFQGFSKEMTSLGFAPSPADLAGWGFVDDGDNGGYLDGRHITLDTLRNSDMASFVGYMYRKSDTKTDMDFLEWMAGGIFLNAYMAGGNMYTPTAQIGMNWLASAGKKIALDSFSRHTLMQEGMIEADFVQYSTDKKLF